MPKQTVYKMSDAEVHRMKLLAHNKVLVRIVEKNIDRKTPGGIYMGSPTDTDWHPDTWVERTGVIVNQVNRLVEKETHLWKTKVETQVGDVVWFDYMTGANCEVITTEEGDYYMLDYFDLIVVKRGETLIPLNGYMLCSLVRDEIKSSLIIDIKKYDARYGIVEYMGSCNTYRFEGLEDDDDIRVRDKCVFSNPPVMLEDEYTARLGSQYRITHRYNVVAYERDGELLPTKNHVIIEPDMDKMRGMIIIPKIYQKPNGYGTVVKGKVKGISSGERVRFFAGSGVMIERDGKTLTIVNERNIVGELS